MKKVVNYRPLFYVFIFLLFGLVCARRIFALDVLTITIALIGMSLTIIWLCANKKFKVLAILMSAFFLGIGFFFIGQSCYKINNYQGQVSVVGRVSDSLKEEEHYYTVILDDVLINGKSDKNISLFISKTNNEKIKVGDKLVFQTELESKSLWTLKSFNSYYYRNNIGYSAKIKSANLVHLDGHIKLDERVRLNVKSSLEKNLSSENAGLCYALLFGDKVMVEKTTQSYYKNAGVIHILAVSGLHVSFLLGLILSLMKLCRVNKYVSFVITTICIFIFACLCSFTPSVVRAGLMGIFFMLSKLVGRRYDTLSSLGLAGIIILLISPLSAFDIGFLMSVFCVIGISLLSKLFFKYFCKVMPKAVAGALAVSLASQIITIPLSGYINGYINLLSPFVNLIIVPLFGVIFPYLVVACLICAFIQPLGFLLLPAGWGFSFVSTLVRFFGDTSLMFPVEKVGLAITTLFFVILFVLSGFVLCSFKKKSAFVGIIAILISFFAIVSPYNVSSDLKSVTYLVENGQACFVLTSSGGDRLLVGQNDLVVSYSREYKVNQIEYYLSLNTIDEDDVSALKDYDIKKYIACNGDVSCEGVYLTDGLGSCSEFIYNYLIEDGKVLGVCIYYDEAKLFIASDVGVRYNETYKSYFNLIKPNLVFVGENDEIGEGYNAISYKKSVMTKLSYQEIGNSRFYFRQTHIDKEELD